MNLRSYKVTYLLDRGTGRKIDRMRHSQSVKSYSVAGAIAKIRKEIPAAKYVTTVSGNRTTEKWDDDAGKVIYKNAKIKTITKKRKIISTPLERMLRILLPPPASAKLTQHKFNVKYIY